MKAQYTFLELSEMDTPTFLQIVSDHPLPGDWVWASAFQYAATRLARLQGLVLAVPEVGLLPPVRSAIQLS
jgi:hypothetical protein